MQCYLCKRTRDPGQLRADSLPMCGLGPPAEVAWRCGSEVKLCDSLYRQGLTLQLLPRPLEPVPAPVKKPSESLPCMTASDHHQKMVVPVPKPQVVTTTILGGKVLTPEQLKALLGLAELWQCARDAKQGTTYYEASGRLFRRLTHEGYTDEEVYTLCRVHRIPFDEREEQLYSQCAPIVEPELTPPLREKFANLQMRYRNRANAVQTWFSITADLGDQLLYLGFSVERIMATMAVWEIPVSDPGYDLEAYWRRVTRSALRT